MYTHWAELYECILIYFEKDEVRFNSIVFVPGLVLLIVRSLGSETLQMMEFCLRCPSDVINCYILVDQLKFTVISPKWRLLRVGAHGFVCYQLTWLWNNKLKEPWTFELEHSCHLVLSDNPSTGLIASKVGWVRCSKYCRCGLVTDPSECVILHVLVSSGV